MNTKLKFHLLMLALLSLSGYAHAQGTAIGYQGRLNDGARPATGFYDFNFGVFGLDAGGGPLASNVVRNLVPVTNGVFNVSLDFGAGVFTGAARWLEISVRTNGAGALVILAPRTALLPTPYAIFAGSAGGVANGTVTANQLNTVGPAPTSGQFLSYNGGNLAWTAPGVAAGNIWSALNGNAYYNAGNVGIGTNTPKHRLSLVGGPSWTSQGWAGAVELGNGAALGWQANAAGQRFGMGHSGTGFYLFRTASDPGSTASPALYDFVVNDVGNVGIGTVLPATRLEVNGIVRSTRVGQSGQYVQLDGGDSSSYRLTAQSIFQAEKALVIQNLSGETTPGVNNAIHFRLGTAAASSVKMLLDKDGNVGIGSTTPQSKLEVVGQDALRLVGPQPFLTLLDDTAGYARSRIQSVGGEMFLGPESWLGGDANAYVKIANSGNLSVKSLTIRGGADVAEPFELSDTGIAKGSVVVIDEEQTGKLKLSTRAYDTQVAGIVSGANGINPGISLYQQGALEGGQNVALSGRVYVRADASGGAIKPGDLLTTSATPGHAMKVSDHTRSQGAILGKAMSALKDGQGLVLVLVTLQ